MSLQSQKQTILQRMTHFVLTLTLVAVWATGIDWKFGLGAIFIYLFVEIAKFLFTPKQ